MRETSEEHLLLKWGTLKDWCFVSEPALALLREYSEIGQALGAMQQRDTPRQKEIICELIDLCQGSVSNDWSGEDYTENREAAKQYVMNYGVKQAPVAAQQTQPQD